MAVEIQQVIRRAPPKGIFPGCCFIIQYREIIQVESVVFHDAYWQISRWKGIPRSDDTPVSQIYKNGCYKKNESYIFSEFSPRRNHMHIHSYFIPFAFCSGRASPVDTYSCSATRWKRLAGSSVCMRPSCQQAHASTLQRCRSGIPLAHVASPLPMAQSCSCHDASWASNCRHMASCAPVQRPSQQLPAVAPGDLWL